MATYLMLITLIVALAYLSHLERSHGFAGSKSAGNATIKPWQRPGCYRVGGYSDWAGRPD
jgi:hypothetical protein